MFKNGGLIVKGRIWSNSRFICHEAPSSPTPTRGGGADFLSWGEGVSKLPARSFDTINMILTVHEKEEDVAGVKKVKARLAYLESHGVCAILDDPQVSCVDVEVTVFARNSAVGVTSLQFKGTVLSLVTVGVTAVFIVPERILKEMHFVMHLR